MSGFTTASICSGGGLADIGFQAAGGRVLWGIEIEPGPAAVYEQNVGAPCYVADATRFDFSILETPDHLHVSPSCKHASAANVGAGETDEDRAMGAATERALAVLAPRVFTLENVWGYVRFDSFQRICATLTRLGYMWHYAHVNSADYGVPQTRKRLILRAVQGALLPPLPAPVPWVGWYAAIADLVDTLPGSAFAPWQLKRLGTLPGTTLMDQLNMSNNGGAGTWRSVGEPAFTVSAYSPKHPAPRAFLMSNAAVTRGDGLRGADEPAHTMTAECQGRTRAWLDTGRVVRMTPRALARFQSVPDSYVLPPADKLACSIIGNGVPSLLAQRLAEGLLQ